MEARSLRIRIAGAVALVLLATGFLAAPAAADEPTLSVTVAPGSVDFLRAFSDSEPWTSSVTVEIYPASSDAAPVATLTRAGEELASSSYDFTLPPGDYRIRAVSDGWISGWYTGAAHVESIESVLDLYGWHATSTFDNASIVHVDENATADHPTPAMLLFRATSGVYGIVARWADAAWDPDAMWAPEDVIYAELLPVGGATPVDTQRTSSSSYAFEDVAPGDYTIRATIGRAPEGTDPTAPEDLVDTEVWWYPGTQDALRAGSITVHPGGGSFVAANIATDATAFDGEPAVIAGDLYAGGFASVSLPPDYDSVFGLQSAQVESYEWFLDGEPIESAHSSTLAIPPGTEGQELSAVIDVNFLPGGMRFGYRGAVTVATPSGSVFTAPVPLITGRPILGTTLSAQPGTWTPAGAKSFQWQRDGVAIDGAVARQHIVAEADLGTSLTVTVTGTKPGYMTAHRTSAPLEVDLAPFANAPVPTIRGVLRYGSEVTVGGGTWRPQPVDVTYQWFRDGVPIQDATDAAYALALDDIGASMTVSATGSKPGYLTVAQMSAPSAPVALGRIFAPRPVLIGSAQVGSTLSIDTSTWTPADATITYEWKRNGEGNGFTTVATTPTYTLSLADLNKKVRLAVTVSSPGYETVLRSTAATANVVP